MSELVWVKSSFSANSCVEVARLPDGGRAIRNSRNAGGPVLRFTEAEWDAFRRGMAAGEFDD